MKGSRACVYLEEHLGIRSITAVAHSWEATDKLRSNEIDAYFADEVSIELLAAQNCDLTAVETRVSERRSFSMNQNK